MFGYALSRCSRGALHRKVHGGIALRCLSSLGRERIPVRSFTRDPSLKKLVMPRENGRASPQSQWEDEDTEGNRENRQNTTISLNDWMVLVSGVLVLMGLTYYITSDHFLGVVVRKIVARYIRTHHDQNREELVQVFGEESIQADEHLPLGLEQFSFERASGCLLCGGMTFHGVHLKGRFVTDPVVGAAARDPKAAMELSERSTQMDLHVDKIVVMVPWREVLQKKWRRDRYVKKSGRNNDSAEDNDQGKNLEMDKVSKVDLRDMFCHDIPLLRVQGVKGTVVQDEVKNVAAAAALNMSLKNRVEFRVANLRVSNVHLNVSNIKPGRVTKSKVVPAKRHTPVNVQLHDMVMVDFFHTRSWMRDIALRSKTIGAIDGKPFAIELFRTYVSNKDDDNKQKELQTPDSNSATKRVIVEEVDRKNLSGESEEEKIASLLSMQDVAFPSLMRLICPTFPITSWFVRGTVDGTITTVEDGSNRELFDAKVALMLKDLKVEPFEGQQAEVTRIMSERFVDYMNRERNIGIEFFLQPYKEYLHRRDGYRVLRQILFDVMFREIRSRSKSSNGTPQDKDGKTFGSWLSSSWK